MTILEALLCISSYPISPEAIRLRCIERGLHPDGDFRSELIGKKEYQLIKADVLVYLSEAPSVTQEGISYDLPSSARQQMKKDADRIYQKWGDPSAPKKPRYGYKGSLLRK